MPSRRSCNSSPRLCSRTTRGARLGDRADLRGQSRRRVRAGDRGSLAAGAIRRGGIWSFSRPPLGHPVLPNRRYVERRPPAHIGTMLGVWLWWWPVVTTPGGRAPNPGGMSRRKVPVSIEATPCRPVACGRRIHRGHPSRHDGPPEEWVHGKEELAKLLDEAVHGKLPLDRIQVLESHLRVVHPGASAECGVKTA